MLQTVMMSTQPVSQRKEHRVFYSHWKAHTDTSRIVLRPEYLHPHRYCCHIAAARKSASLFGAAMGWGGVPRTCCASIWLRTSAVSSGEHYSSSRDFPP